MNIALNILISAGATLLAFYVLWVLYLAVMNLKRADLADKLPIQVKVAAAPVALIGVFIDIALNFIPLTVLLLELPREYTISQRLRRHNNAGPGRRTLSRWRHFVARTAEPFLDPFDPDGDHI
jgi:hypothetical protein